MDPVLLSRIQFGLAAGFHFIFPPLTLGLTVIILIVESIFYKKRIKLYRELNTFLVKILALIFSVGVATGIVLEFSFGTNWSTYSRLVGDIFGAPLAAEAVFAFFLESVFIGILIFGRTKVSPRVYLLSAFLVCFGSHLSGLWIIIANSWMQTPAGFEMVNGQAVLTDFLAAALNHSTVERYSHTIIGAWITGSLFAAAIGAWYLLKEREMKYARVLVKISLLMFIGSSFLQFATGHMHAVQVERTQPVKMAAFEGLWDSKEGAPLSLFGIPVAKDKKTYLEIGVPNVLSLMLYGEPQAKVRGLNEFPQELHPPVFITFTTYHAMIALGTLFAFISLLGIYLMKKEKLYTTKWFLKLIIIASPLPVIANDLGWMAAEIGRQPWAVYNVLKTSQAASVVVSGWEILLTIIMFTILYALLFFFFMKFLFYIIKKGPSEFANTEGYGGE